MHSTHRRQFECKKCAKIFITNRALKCHEILHTAPSGGKNACYFCDRKFGSPSGMVTHVRIHTLEKPFFCPEEKCKLEFASSSNFHEHFKVCKFSGNPDLFMCYFCCKNCATFAYLTNHMRTHTDEEPHSCPLCNRKFKQWSGMKAHIRSHTGEKYGKCDPCKKEFCTVGALKAHTLVFHGQQSIN